MSYVSLRADAERMYISPWHFPGMCRGRKTAEVLRRELVARMYGPNHPGFKGKLSDIDAHLTVLVDCSVGRRGRAVQIAISAYGSAQRTAAELAKLTEKRRPNKAETAFLTGEVRAWAAVSRAAYAVYRAARAVRGEEDLGILSIGVNADCMEPWPIPKPAAVAAEARSLVAASHEAVCMARQDVDTAPRRPVEIIPGFEQHMPTLTVPQTLVANLEQFAARLNVAA